MATKNPFDIFALTDQTVFIEALDSEVTFRPLTKKESDKFNQRLLSNYDGKGDPKIDLVEANKINSEKVVLCLIKPKITLEEINGYGNAIDKALQEIVKAIDGRGDEEETDDAEDTTAGN